jgi:DNA-binding LacI/PurR family transcriptional regulator
MTAIGAMREAYDHNIKIPNELSLVGFDDIRLAEFTIPPLTTVQISQHEFAKIAFRALLNDVLQAGVLDPSPGGYFPLTGETIWRLPTLFS